MTVPAPERRVPLQPEAPAPVETNGRKGHIVPADDKLSSRERVFWIYRVIGLLVAGAGAWALWYGAVYAREIAEILARKL